jgi:hypothetical protein
MMAINTEKFEHELRRPLTDEEKVTVEAFGPYHKLALICIEEGVPIKAVKRIAENVHQLFSFAKREGVELAKHTVEMERLSPGVIFDPNKPRH